MAQADRLAGLEISGACSGSDSVPALGNTHVYVQEHVHDLHNAHLFQSVRDVDDSSPHENPPTLYLRHIFR